MIMAIQPEQAAGVQGQCLLPIEELSLASDRQDHQQGVQVAPLGQITRLRLKISGLLDIGQIFPGENARSRTQARRRFIPVQGNPFKGMIWQAHGWLH